MYAWRQYLVTTSAADMLTPLVPSNRMRVSLSIYSPLGNCPISPLQDGNTDASVFVAFNTINNLFDYKDWGEVLREALFAVNNFGVFSLSVYEGYYIP